MRINFDWPLLQRPHKLNAMPRHPRAGPGGYVYHALNRAVVRLPLFDKDGDFAAFERVLALALEKYPIRVLAYF